MTVAYGIAAAFTALFLAVRSGAWFLKPAANRTEINALFRQAAQPAVATAPVSGALDLEAVDHSSLNRAAGAIGAYDISIYKRIVDVAASIGLVVGLSPVLLLTAIAIKLESKGPVFYTQKRVGYQGRIFSVVKFRSMTIDAEKDGPQYASPNDRRITRVGRIIRRLRIDEIPQTINVLRGEMSFVGPRPERPEFVVELEQAIPHYHARHMVKPGLTGWAQVKYEYAATVEGAREKLRYDLYYIRHFTPLLDLLIILMTVRVALFGVGSR